jgi:hypothetical protein
MKKPKKLLTHRRLAEYLAAATIAWWDSRKSIDGMKRALGASGRVGSVWIDLADHALEIMLDCMEEEFGPIEAKSPPNKSSHWRHECVMHAIARRNKTHGA